jgi:acetyltransferase
MLVNPKYAEIGGARCYASIADLPAAPDLAVVVTPPDTTPGIIAALGERGCKAVVVLCQEDAQASCCARDGGTGAALQEETAMSCFGQNPR